MPSLRCVVETAGVRPLAAATVPTGETAHSALEYRGDCGAEFYHIGRLKEDVLLSNSMIPFLAVAMLVHSNSDFQYEERQHDSREATAFGAGKHRAFSE